MPIKNESHLKRSAFIKNLVQKPRSDLPISRTNGHRTPKTIVQYWNNLNELPTDVETCILSWSSWKADGFSHHIFAEHEAIKFIDAYLGKSHIAAFRNCYHPAMQADYFRLCYLLVKGGLYIDADDICIGTEISWLFGNGQLKLQPLCYDIASHAMVDPSIFLKEGAFSPEWIFYFNNNPLATRSGHPVIEHALQRATDVLQQANLNALPEIQETTGPGNLTQTIFNLGSSSDLIENELVILNEWDSFATSKWPLSYRNDARNWRLSNQKKFP